MKNKYSRIIANKIKEFLTEDGWNFSFDDEKGIFKFYLSLHSKLKKLCFSVRVEKNSFIVYAISPIGADHNDPEAMAALCEFICRCNFGLRRGCFEVDHSDSEIRYRFFVDCEGIEYPSHDMIENSIYFTASTFEEYGDGFVDVIFGGVTPEEAVKKCEKSDNEQLGGIVNEMLDKGLNVDEMIKKLAEIVRNETSTNDENAEQTSFSQEVDSLSDEETPESK